MVSDQDIELLEASLDAHISLEEQAALDVRLGGNLELAQALASLIHERQGRAAAWESLAFTDASVDHAIGRIEQSLDRRSWFQGLVGQWQRLAVAAACLAMFATGMYFQDIYGPSSQRSPMHNAQPASWGVDQVGGTPTQQQFEFRVNDPSGNHQFRTLEEAEAYIARLRMQQQQQFEFRVNDPSGSHQFHTLEEAQAYIARLQMQQRLNAPQPLPR